MSKFLNIATTQSKLIFVERQVGMRADLLINGELVRLARHTRGMTQKQLSSVTNIPGLKISRMEAGTVDANEDILATLAIALDYPVHFFYQKSLMKVPGADGIFHRKRKNLPSKKLFQVYALGDARRLELEKLIAWDGHECTIPKYPVDMYDEDPEKIARSVRAVMQLPNGPVFNLTQAIEEAGGIVVSHDFGTRQMDGFSITTNTAPPIFHMNRALPPDRWRWTLAHELGHVVMCQDPAQSPDLIETQANLFAGELLAPGHEIMPLLGNLTLSKLAGLKLEWKISMQALVMRAAHIGTITPSQKKSLFAQIGNAGYRTREPETLDPPTEYPTTLFRLAKTYMTEVGYSRTELMDYLAVNERDFDAYYRDLHDGASSEVIIDDEGDEWSLKGLTP